MNKIETKPVPVKEITPREVGDKRWPDWKPTRKGFVLDASRWMDLQETKLRGEGISEPSESSCISPSVLPGDNATPREASRKKYKAKRK